MINIRDDNQTHTHKRTVPLPSSFLSSPSFSFSSPLPFLLYIIPFSPSPRSLPLVLPLQHRSLNNVGSVSSRGRRAHRCFSVANGKWQYIHYLCPHSSFLSLWLLHTHTHSHAHTHTPHTHTHTHIHTHTNTVHLSSSRCILRTSSLMQANRETWSIFGRYPNHFEPLLDCTMSASEHSVSKKQKHTEDNLLHCDKRTTQTQTPDCWSQQMQFVALWAQS